MRFVYTGVLTGLLLGIGPIVLAQDAGTPVELGPVVVTATRQEEETLRVPSHVTVITQEDIQKSNATNAGDLLKTEAGLWVTNTSGSTPSGIFIDGRGFNNGGGNGSRMLVLIDGRRANLADTSNPDWASIPIDTIERIEIVRGPSTSLYGDNAMAGVINVITRQGGGEAATDLALEHGSYDFWKRNAVISETKGALSYYFYGGYESTDGYRVNSDYQASNYVGNFAYKGSSFTTLHFRSRYLSNKRLLPGALTESEIVSVGRRGSVIDQDHGETRQVQFDFGLDSYLDKNHWIELMIGEILRGEDFRITSPGFGVWDAANDSRSLSVTGKYRVAGPLDGRDSRLVLGTDLLKETVKSPSTSTDTSGTSFPDKIAYERRLIGAYAHEELSIHPALILTLSGRMDWSGFQFSQESSGLSGDRSFRIWSPKAGLTYLTSPSTSLYATWSRSFRFPNRDELTGFFGLSPELDPERATTYEVGNKIQVGRVFEGTGSVFRTEVKNEILYIPSVFENQNLPEVRHEGIEVSSMIRTSETVRWKGSYTMTRTEITEGPFKGRRLPITPKHTGSATMDWGKEKGPMLSVTGRFVGRRIPANDLANAQEKLPSYTVVDVKLIYRGESLEIYVGTNNVFNRKYEEFGVVSSSGSGISVYPSPERNFIGGMTLRF
jgi:iron complex outermembrane recepter protein